MDKPEFSCAILSKLNLDDIEKVVNEAYHKDGPGRPPRKPMGIFKALIIREASADSQREGTVPLAMERRQLERALRRRSGTEPLSFIAVVAVQETRRSQKASKNHEQAAQGIAEGRTDQR